MDYQTLTKLCLGAAAQTPNDSSKNWPTVSCCITR